MNRNFHQLIGAAFVSVVIANITSCKERADAVGADLGEAGYKMTPEDWFRASRGNDVAALKKFIAGGFDATTRDEKGDSAMHAAAAAGAQGVTDFLLGLGLPVDLRGHQDRTPLMSAVIANQSAMVAWLLRNGADPRSKDHEGFMPIMLAAREGSAGSVEELAPYNRGDLDSALLLAALVGQVQVIDTLTNHGASIYARMEDGRTALMIAAQNGHGAAANLLLDIGASRFSIDDEGKTAADLATAAGHADLAALLSRDPLPEEMALETTEEAALAMQDGTSPPPKPLEGETLGPSPAGESPSAPFIMRRYRDREMPVQIRSVDGETALVRVAAATPRDIRVKTGGTIPGSRLVVIRMRRRMEDSKVNLGKPVEISVVEVRDPKNGATREWIAGVPPGAHDPVALVEDPATGSRYLAKTGQRFKMADGTEMIVTDVRPNQIVVEDAATGAVQTILLRGPRG